MSHESGPQIISTRFTFFHYLSLKYTKLDSRHIKSKIVSRTKLMSRVQICYQERCLAPWSPLVGFKSLLYITPFHNSPFVQTPFTTPNLHNCSFVQPIINAQNFTNTTIYTNLSLDIKCSILPGLGVSSRFTPCLLAHLCLFRIPAPII